MSFVGSVPKLARFYIQKCLKEYQGKEVFVCCSGNFTIDKIAHNLGLTVHSNDIALYSKAIADIVMDKPREFECIEPTFSAIFERWAEHKYKPLVEVMFVIEVSKFEKQKNDYERLLYSNHIEKSGEFYARTIAKLEKNNSMQFKIDSFYFGDFREHLKNEGISLIFAPTYKAGYEKMYKRVDEVFKYTHANYQMFDSKAAGPLYKSILEKQAAIIYSDIIFPDIESKIVAKINLLGGKKQIFIYSNTGNTKHVVSERKTHVKRKVNLIPYQQEFNEATRISAIECKVDEINYYKQFFMGAKVDYSTGGDIGMMFMAEGKIFGFAVFSKTLGTGDRDTLFLLADFICTSAEKRLSKLVLYLLKSKEVQQLLSRKLLYKYTGLQTTVYTNHPVSMKYRGAFQLKERGKGKLSYICTFNGETLTQNYFKWLKETTKK